VIFYHYHHYHYHYYYCYCYYYGMLWYVIWDFMGW
jgi:hypothetical protein